MTSPEKFPDIEIYLKRVESGDILKWLEQVFGNLEVTRTEPSIRCKINGMFCTITEQVAKGGFSSIWFESNQTPWHTDKDCARVAYEHFKTDTRCSTGGWEGDEEDNGGWFRISDKGEQVVNWHQ
jgi:hypothetical protein